MFGIWMLIYASEVYMFLRSIKESINQNALFPIEVQITLQQHRRIRETRTMITLARTHLVFLGIRILVVAPIPFKFNKIYIKSVIISFTC